MPPVDPPSVPRVALFAATPAPVLCLVRDLMFAGKITVAAGHAAVAVRVVRDPAQLTDLDGRLLIVDLNQAAALPAAVAWRRRTGRPVVGFVAHVDAETIAAARTAGVDRVLARSAFAQQLPTLLAQGDRDVAGALPVPSPGTPGEG